LDDAHAAGFQSYKDYAEARRLELLNALELAGIEDKQVVSLNVPDQQSSFHLAEIAQRITEIFHDARAGAVLTHPYEGGHPDHDATAFAVHAACALLPAPPEIYEFTSYHARDGKIEMGRFLIDEEPGVWIQLSNEERERKRRMVECFATQQRVLHQFPIDVECFRAAPVYDFTTAPHAGPLFYENLPWGMTGERWRQLAAEAREALKTGATL